MNLRLDRGVQQQKLAEACGLTPGAICRIESGRNEPKGQTALAIARHLGVTLEYLLDESGPYQYQPPKKPKDLKDGMVTVRLTQEEKALIEALRAGKKTVWELARELPYASLESLILIHRLVLGGVEPRKKKA